MFSLGWTQNDPAHSYKPTDEDLTPFLPLEREADSSPAEAYSGPPKMYSITESEGYPASYNSNFMASAPESSSVASLSGSASSLGPEYVGKVPPPLFPRPPPPLPKFQAGELTHFESTFEHAQDERESVDQGQPPWHRKDEEASLQPAPLPFAKPEMLRPVPRPFPFPPSYHYYDQHYHLLSGRLPPGTLTHYQSDHEHGRDYWKNVHYKRYDDPLAPQPQQYVHTQNLPRSEYSQEPQQPGPSMLTSYNPTYAVPGLPYMPPGEQNKGGFK